MSFYIIALSEKKGDIEEVQVKMELSTHEREGQEERAGGKFLEILRK